MMQVMSAAIAVICAVPIMLTWNTALAVAWSVALAGWIPQFSTTTRGQDFRPKILRKNK